MDESNHPPPIDRVVDRLEQGAYDEAATRLERIETASGDDRKEALYALRSVAQQRPSMVGNVGSALTSFLEDDERPVRLATAKLFVALAEATPGAVVPVVSALAERLADDEEFYYVRARSAEALGYVALEHPEEASSPELLADLRVGLSFDEPEVKEKLAKALECIALGKPSRLRHQVPRLAEHLDDETELVRYHLTTTLVVVECEYPGKLTEASEALAARLGDADENPYVRGRAAEALGLLARVDHEDAPITAGAVPEVDGDSFVTDRVRFARNALADGNSTGELPEGVGSVEAVRGTADEIRREIVSPDGDEVCPHCGLVLPEVGPPACPQCGVPR